MRSSRRSMDSDQDKPTPRASGLWSQWRDYAEALDARLRAWALPRSRVGPMLDAQAARRAFGYAAKARALANEFADWPFHPPENSARAIQELADLQRDGENLMAGLG